MMETEPAAEEPAAELDGPCESDPYGCGVTPEVPSDVVDQRVSWDEMSLEEQQKIMATWTDAQPRDEISEESFAETELDVSW